MQSFMETLNGNLGPILLYCATFLGLVLRTGVEVRRIIRKFKANQRDARDEQDEIAHVSAAYVDRSEERKAELISAGWSVASPGIFVKSVKPMRRSASASSQGRDPSPVA